MFNPFRKLTGEKLDSLIQAGQLYMAVQHFKREYPDYSPGYKTGILITAYTYEFEARKHLEHLENPRYSAFIDLHYTKHLFTVKSMLDEVSPYTVFSGNSLCPEETLKKAMLQLQPALLAWLNRDVDIDPILSFEYPPRLEIIYGEVYIVIGEGIGQKKIRLNSIENG